MTMLNIIFKTFKQTWKSLLVYALVFLAYGWMIVAIFPSMQKALADMGDFYSQMPEGFFEAFGANSMDLSNFNTFISLEYLGIILPFVMIAFVVGFITRHITKEIETGTMELLLSKPITRSQVILSKLVVVLIESAILIAITVGSIILFTQVYNIEITNLGFVYFGLSAFAYFVAIIGVTFFFSVMFRDRGKAIAASVGVLVGMYAINIVTNLKESLEKIDYISFWHYYQPQEIIENVKIFWLPDILVLVAVGVVMFSAAFLIFKKRDF